MTRRFQRSESSALLAVTIGMAAVSIGAALGAQRPDEVVALEQVIRRAVEKVAPSVVTIETFGGARQFQGDPRSLQGKPGGNKLGPLVNPGFIQAQGATTGLVLSSDGLILTSRFNLSFDPTTILVTLADGRRFTAKAMGQDKGRGLALLKVEADDLPVPSFATPEQTRVGQWALLLGRSFGGTLPSVHLGIVSALDRLNGRAIQVDAYASPANYGGPLVDIDGRVLGLMTPVSPDGREASADWYDSGIGFAATWTDVPGYVDRLGRGEFVEKGFLGVNLDLGFLGPGARVTNVTDNSPASGAGLRKGDVILVFDGQDVRHNFHLQDLVGRKSAGDFVHLKFRRPPGPAVEPQTPQFDPDQLPEGAPKPRPKFDPAMERPTVVPEGGEIVALDLLLAERPKEETKPLPRPELKVPTEEDR